jgi:hypothetical protein
MKKSSRALPVKTFRRFHYVSIIEEKLNNYTVWTKLVLKFKQLLTRMHQIKRLIDST